jgi:transcriptional regulator with XRE-family HTH domain
VTATTSELARWLRRELQQRGLTQNQAAVYAGVAPATLSEVLNRGHVPKVETLFRLADYFATSREAVLRLAGHLPATGHAMPTAKDPPSWDSLAELDDDYLIDELLAEFRKVPDAWKAEAIAQVALFARLAEQPPARIIGAEDEDEDGDEKAQADQEAATAA